MANNFFVDFPSLISEVDEEGATPLLKALVSFKNYTAPAKDENSQKKTQPRFGRGRFSASTVEADEDTSAGISLNELNRKVTILIDPFVDNVNQEKTVSQLKNFLKCLEIILSQSTVNVSTAFIKLAKKVKIPDQI